MSAGDFRLVQPLPSHLTVRMLAGGADLNEGEMVRVETGLVVAGDANTTGAVAITLAPIKAGEFGPVAIGGVWEGTAAAGVNFAPGAKVYNAANGQLDTGSTNDRSCGYVVNDDPVTAGKVQFVFTSLLVTSPFVHG